MTLVFAGEVSNSQTAALRSVGAAARLPEFEVCFDALEFWQKSEVVVAAATEFPAELQELQYRLRVDLARLGLALDSRAFRPHVTLARKVSQAPVLQALSKFCWPVRSFQLVRSAQSAAGSVYTVVDSWPLLDSAACAE